jgi:hypothetical protein
MARRARPAGFSYRRSMPSPAHHPQGMANGDGDSAAERPMESQDPEPSAMASPAREFPGACGTRLRPPLDCVAREATEAAVRSRRSSGPGYHRNWGRSPRTPRCNRPRHSHPPCGPAACERQPRYRGQADRQAEMSRPVQPRRTATGHGNRVDAGQGHRPVRYLPQDQRRRDRPLNTPPGSRTCHCRVWSSDTVIS